MIQNRINKYKFQRKYKRNIILSNKIEMNTNKIKTKNLILLVLQP